MQLKTRRKFLQNFSYGAISLWLLGGKSSQAHNCLAKHTENNPQGPFYKPNVPSRDIANDAVGGQALTLDLVFQSTDCQYLRKKTIEIWHTDPSGNYDLKGYRFRTTHIVDYKTSINTVRPGRYYDRGLQRYRPAHIHVKVSMSGYDLLTTQLYFPDDPYNIGDPFFKSSLVLNGFSEQPTGAGQYYGYYIFHLNLPHGSIN